MTSKRYVLLMTEGEVASDEWKDLARVLEQRFGKVKAIPVKGNGSVLVIKTDNEVAPRIRECQDLRIGGSEVKSVLTSGSIGKLKRLAGRSGA